MGGVVSYFKENLPPKKPVYEISVPQKVVDFFKKSYEGIRDLCVSKPTVDEVEEYLKDIRYYGNRKETTVIDNNEIIDIIDNIEIEEYKPPAMPDPEDLTDFEKSMVEAEIKPQDIFFSRHDMEEEFDKIHQNSQKLLPKMSTSPCSECNSMLNECLTLNYGEIVNCFAVMSEYQKCVSATIRDRLKARIKKK